MVSIFDLPRDADGLTPEGLWMVVLRDMHSDGIGGAMFKDGVSLTSMDGHALRRLCVSMDVIGARRVEGGPCEIGDLTRLDASSTGGSPVVIETSEPELVAAPATTPESAGPYTPTTMAELEALSEDALRALGAELDLTDRRWSTQRLQREIAEKLGIEATVA